MYVYMYTKTYVSMLLQYKFLFDHLLKYPTSISLGILHTLGALLGVMFLLQSLSGLFLSFWYVPSLSSAFALIEGFSRDGLSYDLLRAFHANVASIVFCLLYGHIFKALVLRTFHYPRSFLWSLGAVIYILSIGSAFLGYVLVTGQMSYWALVVISSLLTAIPSIGSSVLALLLGSPCITGDTLIRVYSLHFLLPLACLLLVLVHILLLHLQGNGSSIPMASVYDKVPFSPFLVAKDGLSFHAILIPFVCILTYSSDFFNHPDNAIVADACVTPAHIVPEWYLLYWYGLLRSIPSKTIGILAMVLGLVGLVLLSFSSYSSSYITSLMPLSSVVSINLSSLYVSLVGVFITALTASYPPVYPFTHLGLFASVVSLFISICVRLFIEK